MVAERQPQLAYSEQMALMLDEQHRRGKAAKILAVLRHFLGRPDLAGLRVADIGCSAGYLVDELAAAGTRTVGLDIDVPGLAAAQRRFGAVAGFACADGAHLPVRDGSLDVVILNQVYEHVVDADAVLADVGRALAPDGVVYLGLGNRLGVVEPHYRLPFLSWLPPAAADRYVRAAGRADSYYERFRTRPGLRRMLRDWTVWDYTLPVLTEPGRFAADDVVRPFVARQPLALLRAALPLVPTYLWVATKGDAGPRGAGLRVPPQRLSTAR